MRRASSLFLLVATAACQTQPAGPAAASATPAASASASVAKTTPAASAAPAAAPAASAAEPLVGKPCGALRCQLFDTPAAAFAYTIRSSPVIVAVGEAHAQRGSKVPTATKRFTETMLPQFEGKASDLVLELMQPAKDCKKETKRKVEKQERKVVKKQASTNKNEFVELGNASKALSIRPHVLRPSCADMETVAKAGPDGVAQMLTMTADLTVTLTGKILARNAREKKSAAVIAYGGAMHNDLAPPKGREAWSFGKRLQERVKGAYVAVDLIVPEFIRDTPSWKALPWHEHFDPKQHPDKVTLYTLGPKSYVLIFPKHAKD